MTGGSSTGGTGISAVAAPRAGPPVDASPVGDHTTGPKHCRQCGSPVSCEMPPADNRVREVCRGCGTVHYNNPLNVVGTVTTSGTCGESVLLCRRAIAPRVGYWTLPAGFLELGETVAQGALRETQEEAGAKVELLNLFALLDVLPAGQVHLLFRARLLEPQLLPGPETIEAKLFEEHEVPWDCIAFRTVEQVLRHYFQCRALGQYPLLVDRIE